MESSVMRSSIFGIFFLWLARDVTVIIQTWETVSRVQLIHSWICYILYSHTTYLDTAGMGNSYGSIFESLYNRRYGGSLSITTCIPSDRACRGRRRVCVSLFYKAGISLQKLFLRFPSIPFLCNPFLSVWDSFIPILIKVSQVKKNSGINRHI